jgi:hypothetical protein
MSCGKGHANTASIETEGISVSLASAAQDLGECEYVRHIVGADGYNAWA